MILRIPFLIVRLACLIASKSYWHRLTNYPHLDCPSLQPLRGVPESRQRLVSTLKYRNGLCWTLAIPPWQRSLTVIQSVTEVRVARSQLEVHLLVLPTLGRRVAMGDGIPGVLQSLMSSPLSSSVVQCGTLPKFLHQWRRINSNKLVLIMVKGYHFQLMCNHLLFP